jgi:protein SCO1/2
MKPAALLLAATALLLATAPAAAHEKAEAALAVSQSAIGRRVPDLTFSATDGSRLSLADLRGKPVLLTLIYTACTDVCPAVVESLVPAVGAGEDIFGEGTFSVVTVGFDTQNDTPERMRAFARQHHAGGANWHFASADTATMDRLTEAVGFDYFASAGGFEHMAQVTVIDKAGKVYQQIYGSTFEPPQIVEPLKELIYGREKSFFSIAGLTDRVKLFCTVYNPNTGRYYFNYSLFISIVMGGAALAFVLLALVRETRKTLRSGGS